MTGDPSYPLVDAHTHLTWPTLASAPGVLERARAAGVVRMLSAATDLPSSEAVIALAGGNAEVYAAVGIHPNDVQEGDDFDALAGLATRARVVAIGETGLDYYRDHTPRVLQRQSLDLHLSLAERLHLPIVIHNRAADADLIDILSSYRGRVRGMLHCFSGDRELATRGLDLGFYLSFAGNLTYPRADTLRDVAAWAPIDRLLVETDAPFLAPVPHRGRQNEPAYIADTLRALALCRDIEMPALAEQIAGNAQTLLAW